jgi:hypothetical protein
LNVKRLPRKVEMLDAVSTGLHPSAVTFEPVGKCDASETGFESFQVGELRELKKNCNLRGIRKFGCGF